MCCQCSVILMFPHPSDGTDVGLMYRNHTDFCLADRLRVFDVELCQTAYDVQGVDCCGQLQMPTNSSSSAFRSHITEG